MKSDTTWKTRLRNRLLTKEDRCRLALLDPDIMRLVMRDLILSSMVSNLDIGAVQLSRWGRSVVRVLG